MYSVTEDVTDNLDPVLTGHQFLAFKQKPRQK